MIRNCAFFFRNINGSWKTRFNYFVISNHIGKSSSKPNCGIPSYSSWKYVELPETLSDIEEYVKRDFTFSDLKNQLDKNNQLTAETKQTLLGSITTMDGVLDEIARSCNSGTLWPEELMSYFAALIRTAKTPEKLNFSHNIETENTDILDKCIYEKLHDSMYFQILLKHALVASSTLPTYHLSQFFSAFIRLQIPPASNTMLLLTARLQQRINELFPDEILTCLRGIQALEKNGVSYMKPLRDGFFLHLENQLLDPPTFSRILQSMPVANRLSLLRYGGSRELTSFISVSVKETVQSNPKKSLRNKRDAEIVLHNLWRNRSPRKYLYGLVAAYFDENPHELTERSRQKLADVLNRLGNLDESLR